MHIHPGLRIAAGTLLFAALPLLCSAVETHIWEQSEQADFLRGTADHLSIRSDGRVSLAPVFKELDSTTVPYLWAVARDSKGTLFYAGGAPTGASARIFALPQGGKPKTLADIPGLEIHALAVDSQDRLYAAVLPDAKVYRIDKTGKAEVFFEPKCKYIWAMAFDRAGNLFVATGDSGVIYKVTPDGRSSTFLDTEEAHVRSLILDSSGNLIAGTEPGGLVLRITPGGEPFVLYQTDKREVTALAERNGTLYAAAVGSKSGPATVTGPEPVLPTAQPAITGAGAPRAGAKPPTLPPAVGTINAAIAGGSNFYRISADGFAERIWESASDIIYAVSFDPTGRPLLGTGNKGVIYRVDSDQLSTQLLNAPPTQVTGFLQGPEGIVYAVTGNVGNLYSIGPGVETTGTLESDTLDANQFAYWGKAHVTATRNNGTFTLETRSGNLSNPQHDWSSWSPVPIDELGGTIKAPPARFLQYRLRLTSGKDGSSPEITTVDIPFLPRNIAPRLNQIELAPMNYREPAGGAGLERSILPSGSPTTLTVSAVGSRRTPANLSAADAAGAATLQYSKGFVTVRWSASDANRDALIYTLEIRGKNQSTWRPLKDKLTEPHFSFDTSAFPDGEYVVRITASDAPSNPPAGALTGVRESDPFLIDNTPPQLTISNVKKSGADETISFAVKDSLSWIDKAEYSIDGGDWTVLLPSNKVNDSQSLDFQLSVPAGHLIAVRAFDEDDNVVVKQVPPQ
jgi:sugar lactone lactonase YvrE